MFSSKFSTWFGILIIVGLTIILYWQFFLLGKIPMPGDTLIGAYFPWLDYKWGFPVGVPVKNALISDVFSQFFIWKYLIVDIFRSGQIPLWNIYSLSGTPILATYHSSVFNPFNLLLFLPKYYGWGFFISMQTFVAMLGMFLFLGLLVKNLWARIFGSIIFALSGLMTTWVEFGTGVWAASMLPWIFLFLEKYYQSKKIRFLFGVSISFIILYLSGHAQLTLYSTILVFVYLLVKFVKEKKIGIHLLPAIFIFLAIGFCAFQFLPTYEFTKNSIREAESYSSSFNFGLNPIYEVVKFFAADFFGNPTTYNYWDSQSYHEQSIFLGTIPFVLILSLIIFYLQKRQFNFWLGVFLTTLVLGFENPLSKLFYSLPLPLITYSSAARIFFLTSFTGAILASIALEKLSEEKFLIWTRKINFAVIGGILGILLGFGILIWFFKDYEQLNGITAIVGNYKVTLKNLVLPLAVAIFFLLSLYAFRFSKYKNIILIILVAVTFFDLSRYFYKYNPFIAQDLVFPKTPAIQFLQNQPGLFRIGRGDREVMPPNTWSFYKLQSIEGYDPLLSKDYARLFNLVNGYDINATPSRYRELESNNYTSNFLNSLNTDYFLTVKRDSQGKVKGEYINEKLLEAGLIPIFEDGNTAILKNPNSKPRAYYASNVKSFKSESDLVSKLVKKDFDPTSEALVISSKQFSQLEDKGEVEVLNYSPNRIEIKTKTEGDSFLVFADSFDKGWKLYRNDSQEELFKTNLSLRGFSVSPGENNYIMVYFPDSFKYGLWISAASICGYLGILFYTLRKKKI